MAKEILDVGFAYLQIALDPHAFANQARKLGEEFFWDEAVICSLIMSKRYSEASTRLRLFKFRHLIYSGIDEKKTRYKLLEDALKSECSDKILKEQIKKSIELCGWSGIEQYFQNVK